MTELLPRIEIESAPQPSAAVIWLHGLGADGNDFAALVPELDLRACPPIRFVFPHAPSRAVTVNGGYVMPAWYDILGADLVQRQDAAGIAQSATAINALIENEIGRGIAARMRLAWAWARWRPACLPRCGPPAWAAAYGALMTRPGCARR